MKFRTEYKPEKSVLTLNPGVPAVLAGSCFSINIARKMDEHGWEAVNPLSTLYNPVSILEAIDMMSDLVNGSARFENSLFYGNDIWSSWWFDSSFSSVNREDCREEFKIRQNEFKTKLEEGKLLIITFGTSICYYLCDENFPVGNCHKQPAALFYRKRLTIEEIVEQWNQLISKLQNKFKDLKIIFTVSPVRHLKDGFSGNSRSKAVLQLAVEEICGRNKDCFYFPAYEILNDDLRDYRFYASDLSHPSEEAIEYIWQKFLDTFIDSSGQQLLEEGARHFKALNHKPKLGALNKPLKKG